MAYAAGHKNKFESRQLRATPRFRLQNPVRLHACTLPLIVRPPLSVCYSDAARTLFASNSPTLTLK